MGGMDDSPGTIDRKWAIIPYPKFYAALAEQSGTFLEKAYPSRGSTRNRCREKAPKAQEEPADPFTFADGRLGLAGA